VPLRPGFAVLINCLFTPSLNYPVRGDYLELVFNMEHIAL